MVHDTRQYLVSHKALRVSSKSTPHLSYSPASRVPWSGKQLTNHRHYHSDRNQETRPQDIEVDRRKACFYHHPWSTTGIGNKTARSPFGTNRWTRVWPREKRTEGESSPHRHTSQRDKRKKFCAFKMSTLSKILYDTNWNDSIPNLTSEIESACMKTSESFNTLSVRRHKFKLDILSIYSV